MFYSVGIQGCLSLRIRDDHILQQIAAENNLQRLIFCKESADQFHLSLPRMKWIYVNATLASAYGFSYSNLD